MAHIVSVQARADLDRMWDYLYEESGSADVADRQIDAITRRFYLLGDHPFAGRARDDDLGAGRRSFTVRRRYVIVYTVTADDDVLILRVAHARQDLAVLLGGGR